MDTACWPPPGQEIFSKAQVGSEDGGTVFAACHCQAWREGGFTTSDDATAALVAHRGESPIGGPDA